MQRLLMAIFGRSSARMIAKPKADVCAEGSVGDGQAIPNGPPTSQPSSGQSQRLQVLSLHECLDYLHSGTLGRLAFQVDREIDVLPVSYATDGSIVVFRTGSMTRLQRSPRVHVTFEVDSWDQVTGVGWSVVLKGVAREVTNGGDLYSSALRRCDVQPLAPGKREHWIAIYPSEITGRRFYAPGGSDLVIRAPSLIPS